MKTFMLCINYHIPNIDDINKQESLINKLPTFQSEKNISQIYDKKGKLKCKLITQHIQYSNNTKTVYLIQPIATLFNDAKIPIWNIKAQKAKITYNKIMYLDGNVQITYLIKHARLKSISTNTAILNLITYDIFSGEKTIIHGIQFDIVSMNMRANLKKNL